MFAPSIVVAATGLNDGATGIALSLAAAGAWALSSFMLGQGVKAEIAYNERKIAKRPAIPRKIIAAALCGIGVGIAAYRNDGNLFATAILGGLGIALFLLSFGIDLMRDKGATGVDQFQSDRVALAVDQGETYLREMQDAILRANDRNLTHRVSQFATTARDMFRTVEEDPRDLTSARKFMSVYLQGARDATIVFADIYARSQDAETRTVMRDGRAEQHRVQKIRWFPASGRVRRFFDDILVLASKSLPKRFTDNLEPWDLSALEPYTPEYLAGFRAEGYSIDIEDGFIEARAKMDQVIARDVGFDIGGDRQRVHQIDTQVSDITFKHILLPVWMAAYKFRGQTYRFVINGRTGRVQGERPWSTWKIALAILVGLAIAGSIGYFAALNQG